MSGFGSDHGGHSSTELTWSRSEKGKHDWKIGLLKKLLKNAGQDGAVKLFPRLLSNGCGNGLGVSEAMLVIVVVGSCRSSSGIVRASVCEHASNSNIIRHCVTYCLDDLDCRTCGIEELIAACRLELMQRPRCAVIVTFAVEVQVYLGEVVCGVVSQLS